MQPLQHLFQDLIDYAGLFPPAALDMAVMSDNFAQYMQSDENWMLGRVVVPLARVADFNQTYSGPSVRISALTPALDSDEFSPAIDTIAAFNQHEEHKIDAVEVRTNDLATIANATKLPDGVCCFVEVPLDQTEAFVKAIASLNQPHQVFAKIRTGGVKPELIPDASLVAELIVACKQSGIGFKATAGLHHPCRAVYPLTYETNCDSARMHGFLNVFLASCFVNELGWDANMAKTCIDELTAEELEVSDTSIKWRGHEVTTNAIAKTRKSFAISFGSCSFTEPVEDLTNLSLLPENPNATH
ncbi:MAG: hypothetical protein AB8G99_16650 [Planctomycetaceae bacterium]